MSATIPLLLGGIAFVPAPGMAGTNLLSNGDFESSTGAGFYGITNGTVGLGQIYNSDTADYVQIGSVSAGLPTSWGWQFTNLDPFAAPKGYGFTLDGSADTVGANNSVSAVGVLKLWGPNNVYPVGWPASPRYVPPSPAVTSLASPSGGKFLAIDGVYGRSKVSQRVTGLDTSKSYTLSFEYAGGQQYSPNELGSRGPLYTGDTDQTWIVKGTGGFAEFSLGNKQNANGVNCFGGTYNCWTNLSQSFTPWQTKTITFTPTNSTLDLEFTAWGTTANSPGPTGDNPPFLLLDNVQLLEGGGPPADPAPAPLPVLGGGVAFALARRLRRRVSGSLMQGSSTTRAA